MIIPEKLKVGGEKPQSTGVKGSGSATPAT